MNDWDDSNESEGMKNMRKQIKEQGKLLKEQAELISQFNTQSRGSTITNALTSRGLDAKVAKFYPADLGTDDESVDRWFNENKDVFGPAQPVVPSGGRETELSEREQEGYKIMQAMAAYETSVQQDFESVINKIQYDPANPQKATDELLAALSAQGVNLSSS